MSGEVHSERSWSEMLSNYLDAHGEDVMVVSDDDDVDIDCNYFSDDDDDAGSWSNGLLGGDGRVIDISMTEDDYGEVGASPTRRGYMEKDLDDATHRTPSASDAMQRLVREFRRGLKLPGVLRSDSLVSESKETRKRPRPRSRSQQAPAVFEMPPSSPPQVCRASALSSDLPPPPRHLISPPAHPISPTKDAMWAEIAKLQDTLSTKVELPSPPVTAVPAMVEETSTPSSEDITRAINKSVEIAVQRYLAMLPKPPQKPPTADVGIQCSRDETAVDENDNAVAENVSFEESVQRDPYHHKENAAAGGANLDKYIEKVSEEIEKLEESAQIAPPTLEEERPKPRGLAALPTLTGEHADEAWKKVESIEAPYMEHFSQGTERIRERRDLRENLRVDRSLRRERLQRQIDNIGPPMANWTGETHGPAITTFERKRPSPRRGGDLLSYSPQRLRVSYSPERLTVSYNSSAPLRVPVADVYSKNVRAKATPSFSFSERVATISAGGAASSRQ